jgi:hypothetical protein
VDNETLLLAIMAIREKAGSPEEAEQAIAALAEDAHEDG